MANLSGSLFTGLSGVRAAQFGLNVTGNNIANVNTPGYSRQRADLLTKGSLTNGGVTIGSGADVRAIEGLRDSLAQRTLTDQIGAHGYQEQLYTGLADMEGLMAETDFSGLGLSFTQFFKSLEETTLRPGNLSVRQELLSVAENLAADFRARDADLTEYQSRVNIEVDELVDDINTITETIANINSKLFSTSQASQDLVDQRQAEIDKLSKIVAIDVFDMGNNLVQVNIKDSNQILVGREIRNTVSTVINGANSNFYDIQLTAGLSSNNITSSITGGELGAKLQIRDTEIPTVRDKLDNLAAGLIIQVNTVHQTGTDLNGNTNLNFFDPPNATVLGATPVGTIDANRYQGMAGLINLSSDLIDPLNTSAGFDPSRLALSGTGSVGDNGTALQLAALRENTNVVDTDRDGDPTNDDAGNLEEYYNATLTSLGRATKTAEQNYETRTHLLEQAESRRDTISGVSLDEEALQLTQYQRAFEASSKFLSVINQLTGEIISRIG